MAKLSPGQTDSQVFARLKLGSTCDSVWPGLACTCVDLRSLWSRSNLYASQCKVFTVSPPNASLFENSTCRYLRLLAIPFDQGFNLYFSMITNCVGKKVRVRHGHYEQKKRLFWPKDSTERLHLGFSLFLITVK